MVKAQLPIQKFAKKSLLIKEAGKKVIKAKLVTEKGATALLLNRKWVNMTRVKILRCYSPYKRMDLRNLLDATLDPEQVI